MFDDFFMKSYELVKQGVPFVTATVVRAEKPTSGKPGDKAIITAAGVMYGWIGGSCAQPTVIQQALNALAADEVRLIRLSPDPEARQPRVGVIDVPMTCYSGGTLEIVLEPQHPRPRLLIVGTLPVARALARLGAAMNYHVLVADLEGGAEPVPDAAETLSSLEEVVSAVRPFTYTVVATHGTHDELALARILAAQPAYVGLVASPRRAGAVRDYLAAQGLSQEELALLKAPAGLDIQARRGDEIALSIMAEIVQRRRNAELLDLALFHQETTDEEAAAEDTPCDCGCQEEQAAPHHEAASHHEAGHHHETAPAAATAIDPICGMTVEIATAGYTSTYQGQSFYFCCAGCKMKFDKDPAAALASA